MRSMSRRPSPALVVSIVALVMATAGTATAAKVLITSSSQIKNGVVSTSDVKDNSISTKDLRNGGVTNDDIKSGTIEVGKLEASARAAISTSQTSAVEVFRKDGPVGVPKGQSRRVATIANLEPGVYAIFAKTVITVADSDEGGLFNSGQTGSAHCVLDAGGDKDESRTIVSGPGFNAPAHIHSQITHTFGSPGTVALDCDSPEREWRATDSSIIAIRVSKAPRSNVEG